MRTTTIGVLAALVVVGALALGGGLLGFTRAFARKLITPYRKPLSVTAEDVALELEHIQFPGPHGALAGWYLPARNGCTLVCCHGINDNAGQWFEQIARLHQGGGYGALMFDFAGHGRSEGSVVTYGGAEQEDIAAAMAYLRARGDVDMSRIGLLGYSLGAITSVLYAANHQEFRAVVIESGFADLQRDIAKLFTRYTRLPAFPFAPLVVFWCERLVGARLAAIRPMQVISQISPAAIFIISDLADTLADEPFDGEHLFASAHEPKEFWQVPGAEHVRAFYVAPDEWVRRVSAFLDRHMAPVPLATRPDAPAPAADVR